MNSKSFLSKLSLAYAPMSNYEFTFLKAEKIIQEILADSMLYIIAQRPMLTFENIKEIPESESVYFEIHMQGSNNCLRCELPYYQKEIGKDNTKQIIIHFMSHDLDIKTVEDVIVSSVNGMKFYDSDDNFLLWLSPDKFLHLFWCNIIKANIDGNISDFTRFKVHYVGKSTDQPVYERLTGHDTLQNILSIEKPLIKGTLPTHEITLLLFTVTDGLKISTLEDNIDSFVKEMGSLPDKKTVSLDAEKLLIKLLNPEYNHPTKRFPNYPKSKDGLAKFNFNRYIYQLKDDITLEYSDTVIVGNSVEESADIIMIENNETLSVLKTSVT